MVAGVKAKHPSVPLTLYANGSGGLLERLGAAGADVVGLDWTVDMADARARLGATSVQVCALPLLSLLPALARRGADAARGLPALLCAAPHSALPLVCFHAPIIALSLITCSLTHMPQGNVDPTVLFCGEAAIEAAVRDVLKKAGGRGHILNLGHGVLVGTPEEAVAHMFALSKSISTAELVAA